MTHHQHTVDLYCMLGFKLKNFTRERMRVLNKNFRILQTEKKTKFAVVRVFRFSQQTHHMVWFWGYNNILASVSTENFTLDVNWPPKYEHYSGNLQPKDRRPKKWYLAMSSPMCIKKYEVVIKASAFQKSLTWRSKPWWNGVDDYIQIE